MAQELARPLTPPPPAARNHPAEAGPRENRTQKGAQVSSTDYPLSEREKAAIIVRALLSEGVNIPISALSDDMQTSLTEQMGQMRFVDQRTVALVINEFTQKLEDIGLTFPSDITEAMSLMSSHISQNAASRLQRLAGSFGKTDPWERLAALSNEDLEMMLEQESSEVAAVVLSKLPLPKAADILSKLPAERARKIAYAVAMTENIHPDTVQRIGVSLTSQLDTRPVKAFPQDPVARVGEILNISSGIARESILQGLETEDASFVERVRKVIFVFTNIQQRVSPADIPKIMRLVDSQVLVTAFVGAQEDEESAATAEFLLANIPQRLAQSLRSEIQERGPVKKKEVEEAMSQIVRAVKQLESTGEITLIQTDFSGDVS